MIENLEQHIKEWTDENAPLGIELGYPDCCIKEFCDQPPVLLSKVKPTKDDYKRFDAACINGKFTGFIPCKKHANEILLGEKTLESLIRNRNKMFPKFPNWNLR